MVYLFSSHVSCIGGGLAAAFAAVLLFDIFSQTMPQSTKPQPVLQQEAQTSKPPVQPVPVHNDTLAPSSYEPNFTIETKNSGPKYYYLKIVDPDSNLSVQSVFIHAGKKRRFLYLTGPM